MSISKFHKILWQDSIWFSDVDDTIITTAKTSISASIGIRDVFTSRFGETVGAKMQEEFVVIFNKMLNLHRTNDITEEQQLLIYEIESYQKGLPAEYGKPKRWSREIFTMIAANNLGIKASNELISEAVDAYWMYLTQNASIIPGVLQLVTEIKKHNRPFYLVTGSDVRLSLQNNGRFLYDPHYSESFKRERLAVLRQKGINFNLVSIGDPEDKPHKDFFEKAVRMAEEDLGEKIDLRKAVIIGDSFAADLQTPKEMGYGLTILYEEGKDSTEIIDKHQINTGNLSEVISYLE